MADAQTLLQQGIDQEQAGDLGAAVQSLQQAVDADPTLAQAWLALGQVRAKLGETDAALQAYDQAANLWDGVSASDAGRALELAGDMLLDQHRPAEAAISFRRRLVLQPQEAGAHNDLGRALAAQGQKAEAEEAYREAAKLWHAQGSDWAAYPMRNLGNLLLARGESTQAAEQFRLAAAASPDYAIAHYDLGRALEACQDKAGAAAAYEQAAAQWEIQGSQDARIALRDLGVLLLTQNKPVEAQAALRRAIAIAPEFANAHYDLARALAEQGEVVQAMQAYEVAAAKWEAQSSTDARLARRNVGNLLLDQGRPQEAAEQFRRAIALEPGYATGHNDLGRALARIGDVDGAGRSYAEAARLWDLEKSSDARFAWRNWGNLLLDQHDSAEQAARYFRNALEAAPDFADAQNDLGRALARQGHTDDAIAAYAEAARMWEAAGSADAKYAQVNRGNLLLEQKKADEAEACMRRAIGLDARYAVAHNDLGRALAAQGRHPESLLAYEQAAQLWHQQHSADERYALQNIGFQLNAQEDLEGACARFEAAAKVKPDDADAWYYLANALSDAGQIERSLELYQRSADLAPDDPYPLHNRAHAQFAAGRYREGWADWAAAMRRYEDSLDLEMGSALAVERSLYMASVHSDIYGRWSQAEPLYLAVLEKRPGHAEALLGLARLYVAWSDAEQPSATAAARLPLLARQATQALKAQLGGSDDRATLMSLSDLCLDLGDFSAAGEWLDKAEALVTEASGRRAELLMRRAALHTRQDKHDRAVEAYGQALKLRPADLGLRAKLAAALVKNRLNDRAETEYRRILALAPQHVDALLGLGQLCVEQADGGDTDRLGEAERHLMDAIDCATSSWAGSRRLAGRDLAQVQYQLGYVRVKMYEADPGPRSTYLLQAALRNFTDSRQNDREGYKALAAQARLRKRLQSARRDQLAEWLGPALVCLLCLVVFWYAHANFHLGSGPNPLSAGNYIALTFGALVFFVAGLYLPKVLKLKVPGIELEKASTDQAPVVTSLGIRSFDSRAGGAGASKLA